MENYVVTYSHILSCREIDYNKHLKRIHTYEVAKKRERVVKGAFAFQDIEEPRIKKNKRKLKIELFAN